MTNNREVMQQLAVGDMVNISQLEDPNNRWLITDVPDSDSTALMVSAAPLVGEESEWKVRYPGSIDHEGHTFSFLGHLPLKEMVDLFRRGNAALAEAQVEHITANYAKPPFSLLSES